MKNKIVFLILSLVLLYHFTKKSTDKTQDKNASLNSDTKTKYILFECDAGSCGGWADRVEGKT